MQYRYVGYLPQGGVQKGTIEALTVADARAEVLRRGYKPLRVTPSHPLPTVEELFPSLFRVKTGALAHFARELSTMVGTGVNLLRALRLLQASSHDTVMKRTIGALNKTLEEGGSFSAALAKHPEVFSPLFVSVAEVGESSGRLPAALEQIADALMKEHEAKQKAMRVMMYPMAVMGLSLLTLAVLMTVALPSLVKVFDQMGTQTPLMTRVAIGLATGFREYILHLFVGVLLFLFLFHFVQRKPRVRYRLDALKVRAPLFGPLTILGEVARASRTLAMLLEAGVPLATALQLVSNGAKNQVLRRAFADAEESLMSGHALSEALKRHPVLPVMYVELITIGEETNSLQRTMQDAAAAYQKQFEQRLDALLGMMEPLTTLAIGAIVGFIALSMFTPIYSGMKAIE